MANIKSTHPRTYVHMNQFFPGIRLLFVSSFICLLLFSLCSVHDTHADETVFSIQAGSYQRASDAENTYELMVQKSDAVDLDSLRIEKIGEYYTVRVGRFDEYATAQEFLSSVTPLIPEAIITQAYFKNERIIKIYGSQSPPQQNREGETPGRTDTTNMVHRPVRNDSSTPAEPAVRKSLGKRDPTFRALKEFPHTIDLGAYEPDFFRKISIALYNRGFVHEAVEEMKRAVELSPDYHLYRIELGTLYVAQGDLEKAKDQYYAALRINPSLSKVYHYLGELFLASGNLEMAWLSALKSRSLGFSDAELSEKLSSRSGKPELPALHFDRNRLHMRQILVFSNDKAKNIMKRFSEGELFEELAINESYGLDAMNGGYVGPVKSSDIHPLIAKALIQQEAYAEPVIVQTENGFHIVQRISPFELDVLEREISETTGQSVRTMSDALPGNTLSSLR